MIKNQTYIKKNIFKLLLVIACFTALVSKVFFGFDIDEQYALSMAYRMFKGQMIIKDIWDPYQLSALFLVPLFKIIYGINGGAIILFCTLE